VSLSLLDQLIPIIGALYGIAFFGGYLKQSQTSPVMVWAKNKSSKLPKAMVYLCVFIILAELTLLIVQ
jgi:hypothetical protein